uniref:Triadin n=1 Tax=Suricata suricatta TaxID=37032 RepID=A0A673TGY2_SURSU
MTEITAEGNASTTTTVIDSKNGSMPKSPGKVLKRTVTEDIVTTFSSPAAWLLVIALIITWSAVAVVMFDLVDYKNFSASSISKIGSDPLKLVHDAVEETTDWVYGFFSLLSDIISSEGDEEDDDGDEDTDKGEIEEPPLKQKEIHKDKTEKQEKPERKIVPKAIHKEKIEKKEKPETKTVAKGNFSLYCLYNQILFTLKDYILEVPGWLSQLRLHLLVLAQVMISWLMSLSPIVELCTDRAETAWDSLFLSVCLSVSFSLPLSLPLSCLCSLSLKINN